MILHFFSLRFSELFCLTLCVYKVFFWMHLGTSTCNLLVFWATNNYKGHDPNNNTWTIFRSCWWLFFGVIFGLVSKIASFQSRSRTESFQTTCMHTVSNAVFKYITGLTTTTITSQLGEKKDSEIFSRSESLFLKQKKGCSCLEYPFLFS